MDQTTAQAALQAIPNLTAFAKRSKVPLRTLIRIKHGQVKAHNATLLVLAADLKRILPKPPVEGV